MSSLAYLALVRFITGTSSAENQARAASKTEEEWQEETRAVHASVAREPFRHVSKLAETLSTHGFSEQFMFGIDTLLAGIVTRSRNGC